MRVGILALQGAFAEHGAMLEHLGFEHFEIRKRDDIQKPFDGLILPGGESTVMGKLLRELNLFEPIRAFIQQGMPVLGTCAGMILLAKQIDGGEMPHLATMDITAVRNAYGRQLGSFCTTAKYRQSDLPMVFIRAPYILSAGRDVEILSKVNGKITAVQQNNQIAVAFHPELTEETAVHEHFLSLVRHTEFSSFPWF